MKISKFEVSLKAIEPNDKIEFKKDGKDTIYVDELNKRVKKIQIAEAKYKWLYDDGTEFTGKSFKVKTDGTIFKGYEKPESISDDEIEEIKLSEFLLDCVTISHTYLVTNNELKEKMKSKPDIALCFAYANSGAVSYDSVVYYDPKLDKLIMKCCNGNLNQIDLEEAKEKKVIDKEKPKRAKRGV